MGKRKKEELPDYTVANMDVDGMPWNSRRPWQIFPGDPSKSRKEFDVKVPEPGMENAALPKISPTVSDAFSESQMIPLLSSFVIGGF